MLHRCALCCCPYVQCCPASQTLLPAVGVVRRPALEAAFCWWHAVCLYVWQPQQTGRCCQSASTSGCSKCSTGQGRTNPNFALGLQDFEGQIANFGATRGKRIQAAQNKVAAAKTTLAKAKMAAKTAAQAHLQAVAEGEAAAGERKSLAAQLQVVQQTIQGARRCDMMCVGHEQSPALPGAMLRD